VIPIVSALVFLAIILLVLFILVILTGSIISSHGTIDDNVNVHGVVITNHHHRLIIVRKGGEQMAWNRDLVPALTSLEAISSHY
jgi:hypothetical protein